MLHFFGPPRMQHRPDLEKEVGLSYFARRYRVSCSVRTPVLPTFVFFNEFFFFYLCTYVLHWAISSGMKDTHTTFESSDRFNSMNQHCWAQNIKILHKHNKKCHFSKSSCLHEAICQPTSTNFWMIFLYHLKIGASYVVNGFV